MSGISQSRFNRLQFGRGAASDDDLADYRVWFTPAPALQLSTESPRPERSVKVEGGADQGQVGERLRVVAQRLATVAGLLGKQAEVVGVAEHLLEEQPRVFQPRRVGAPGPGERLDQPEGTHVEGPLAARQAVRGGCGVVTVDQTVRGQAARSQGPANPVRGREHGRVM